MDMSIIGGAQSVTNKLASSLSPFYDVYIMSIQHQTDNTPYLWPKGTSFTYLLPFGRSQRLRKCFYSVYKQIIEYINEHEIDIVFMMGEYAASISILTKFKTKATYIYCDHSSFTKQSNKKELLIRFYSAVLADRIVVLTKYSMYIYINLLHIKKSKITYIYNWIDNNLIDNSRQYHRQSKVIITVGRLAPEKGFDLLVKVAQKTLPFLPDWEWHIYGDGPLHDDICKNIKESGLDKQLLLKGCSNDIETIYGSASLIVLTSYREGLPLVLLEAKAYKLPSVAFDVITGPSEIIANNVNGYLITPFDIDNMAQKIKYLATHEDVRVNMSSHSYDGIDKFSQSMILDRWKMLIEQLSEKNI